MVDRFGWGLDPGGHIRGAEGGIQSTTGHHAAYAPARTLATAFWGDEWVRALVVGVHYQTLQKWVSWYRAGGVEEVLSHRMKGLGQPRFLSEDQERKLTEEVESGRFRTGGELIPGTPGV